MLGDASALDVACKVPMSFGCGAGFACIVKRTAGGAREGIDAMFAVPSSVIRFAAGAWDTAGDGVGNFTPWTTCIGTAWTEMLGDGPGLCDLTGVSERTLWGKRARRGVSGRDRQFSSGLEVSETRRLCVTA